jgi:hypothetical protein
MSIVYSVTAINARLLGLVSAIDEGSANGQLILLANSTVISTITLNKPSGTVNGGVLTFSGPLLNSAAANAGSVTGAQITDSNGVLMISGLTAGIPGSGADIIISNGLNSTFINAGQAVQLLSAQIVGS